MSYFDSKKSKNLSDKKTTKYSLYGGNFEFQKQAINETKCHILIQKNLKIYQTKKTTKYSLYGGNYEFQKQAINETKCHILIQKNLKIYQTKKPQNTHCTGETLNSKNRL